MSAYQTQWQRLKDPSWFPVLLYIYLPVALSYLVWRTTVINWHIWYGPVLYAAELYGLITTTLFLLIAQKMYVPVYRPVRGYKTVDVLIPTYNESLQVLEPVVLGAQRIRGVRQVLVLDDGNRPEVKAMAERLQVKYYPRLTNLHAKAGNLNNGLKHTDAEFLITLDADHIPSPDFIQQTLGYFADPALAVVQSPQTFYNVDSFLFRGHGNRRGWSEQLMFYDCIQLAKNRWNSAFFVGTSAMLRRSAIEGVGQFATGTATEDIHTSLRLHAKGWKSLFIPQVLAYGLEAESFKEFYKQRKRWAAGSLGLLFRSPDSPLRARGLSPLQRLNYFSATIAHLQGVQKFCFFLIPILTTLWMVSPVTGHVGHYAVYFIGFYLVSIGSTLAYARGTYHPLHSESYALANMAAHFGGIKGMLRVQKKFAVSRKLTAHNERTWLTKLLWGLWWLAVIALVRDGWLYVVDHDHAALLLYAAVFTTLNATTLFMFLVYLHRYEHDGQTAERSGMVPDLVQYYQGLMKSAPGFGSLPDGAVAEGESSDGL